MNSAKGNHTAPSSFKCSVSLSLSATKCVCTRPTSVLIEPQETKLYFDCQQCLELIVPVTVFSEMFVVKIKQTGKMTINFTARCYPIAR